MKILASIIAAASADYACCPYDDFGVRYSECPLTEKTPWSDSAGVENNACKAWEANIDATMEGNSLFDNWGGCGFQRHFGWSMNVLPTGFTEASDLSSFQHCTLGMLSSADCVTAATTKTNVYNSLSIQSVADPATNIASYSLSTSGPYTATGSNIVFGKVTLGGICKLFIPVTYTNIDSVSIAGVHMHGSGSAGSVFHSKLTGTGGGVRTGTAYCFSVVNVGEYMENSGTNGVGNGNVAGLNAGVGVTDNNAHNLDGPISESAAKKDFGESLMETTSQTAEKVASGANFDVVVHFKSAWCIRHWTIVDMQTGTDWGNNGGDEANNDYELADVDGSPHHAHTDVADKRFAAGIEGCGTLDSTGAPHDLSSSTSALKCAGYAGSDLVKAINSYIPTNGFKWPNAGAWAAFYSFVTCTDSTLMMYGNGAVGGTETARMTVLSSFYNDVRHHTGSSVNVRGNIRQVGSDITTCGPGILKDTTNQRCTWNWNFEIDAGQATNQSPQDWFDRTAPDGFNSWNAITKLAINRGDEATAFLNNPEAAYTAQTVADEIITVTFGSGSASGTATVIGGGTLTMDDEDHTTVAGTNPFTINLSCVVTTDTADLNVRDIFPDCFMGDEIHFQYTTTAEHITSWFSSAVLTV